MPRAGRAYALSGDDIHLWLLPIPVRHEALRQRVEDLPDKAERTRAARFARADDSLRQLHSRGLLRLLLGHYLAREPETIRFVSNKYGKPALADGDGLHFNLSHCRDIALIGLTRRGSVGVDIERIRPLPDREAIVAHCFSAAEQRWLTSRPTNGKEQDFFRIWTGKEAVLKALGTGFAVPAESISVSLPEDGGMAGRVTGTASPWNLFSDCPDADHAIAAAIRAVINPGQFRCFHVAGGSPDTLPLHRDTGNSYRERVEARKPLHDIARDDIARGNSPNGHGKDAAPDNETRHARFPHPNCPLATLSPTQAGEGANEALRVFHVK